MVGCGTVWAALALAQAVLSGAPVPSRLEIRGVVIDLATGQPLSGAEVSYWKQVRFPDRPNYTSGQALGTTATGFPGTFHFTPQAEGEYYIRVTKEGYGPPRTAFRSGLTPYTNLSVTSGKPVQDVRLGLIRPARITGRIVDEETGDAIGNLRLFFLQDLYLAGGRMLPARAATFTDENGHFAVEVPPDDYIIQTLPRTAADSASRLLTRFSAEDASVVDDDYESTFWPGVNEASLALPLTAGAQDTVDIGLLAVRRTPLYRALLSFPEGICTSGTPVLAMISNELKTGLTELGQPPCGRDFLVRGLAPGQYELHFVAGGPNQTLMRANMTIHVVDENLKMRIPFSSGTAVTGRIVAAAGAGKPPVAALRIFMQPAMGASLASEAPTAPDAEGNFRIEGVHVADQRFEVWSLPPTHYVQQVRYNGSPVRGSTLPLNPAAPSHFLEIVVDDKPASLGGTVLYRDRPVANAVVVLARWPPPGPLLLRSFHTVVGDADGKFRFVGLAPGEYRIFAVAPEMSERLNRPGVLEQLMPRADKLNLPSGVQGITLELIYLR